MSTDATRMRGPRAGFVRRFCAPVLALGLILTAAAGQAQEVIASYAAFIGRADLFNSNGVRLTEPWQVLRQDRANYHRFGISQPGDEWDPLFDDANNRAAMEQMIMRGRMDPQARRNILAGGAVVYVTIYGRVDVGTYVEVDVFR